MNLNTQEPNTWCPGCPNFGIQAATKKAIKDLVEEKYAKHDDFVMTAGVGCQAKIYDYINISGFYGLHGREIPLANGVVLGNPDLQVISFAGDGGAYAEGISHFVHAARMNPNYTLVVHNNKVFALTTGQVTPTSEHGYPGKSTPEGNPFRPMNPISVALEFGASFVAREYALDSQNLSETLKKAIKHRGFSFIDVIQPCISFHDFTDYVKSRMYRIDGPLEFEEALEKAREWDYSLDEDRKIPVGIFYSEERETLGDLFDTKPWAQERPKMQLEPELWDRFPL